MKRIYILYLSCIFAAEVHSQSIFKEVYPIGENPNIGYKTSMVPEKENIIFEANPILRMPIYNNIRQNLMNNRPKASTLYINFRPQFRMYDDVSRPVKMPSYKISLLGFQQLIRLPESPSDKDHFLAFALESGHYSNGQSRSTFNSEYEDGSPESEQIYRSITPATDLSAMLNRESGNFSTNYTELHVKYRKILDQLDFVPLSEISFQLGYTLYHNHLLFLADIGGYSEADIKIYGKNRFYGETSFLKRIKETGFLKNKLKLDRYTVSANMEYIATPHASVQPLRVELTATTFFVNNLGFFLSGIYGHDNYNYRFVDKGKQLFVGMTFDIFPPMEFK